MRILWSSNAPWANTGYGNQTKVFTTRLKAAGHEVAISALYGLEGGVLSYHGMPVYPHGPRADMHGMDVLAPHAIMHAADIAITLYDTWVIRPETFGSVKWIPWMPVDHEPLSPLIADIVSKAYKRIVYSRFGEKMLHDAGLDCYYIPHGVDTKIFHPMDKNAARASLGWPVDKFIFGVVAANKDFPSRKAWPQILEAFAEIAKVRDDVFLYTHTNEFGGVNIREIAEGLGIASKIIMVPQQHYGLYQLNENYMANMYNAIDVLVNPATGEGFGIPIVEAQACGTPVVVGGWTAMTELCFSGYTIRKHDADRYWIPINAYQYMPRVSGIVKGMKWALHNARNPDVKAKAAAGALEYDADLVMERYWTPVLAEIESRVKLWQK